MHMSELADASRWELTTATVADPVEKQSCEVGAKDFLGFSNTGWFLR